MYNHYTLDRRIAHPDPLDRRPLIQPISLDHRTLGQSDPLERHTLAQSDGLERRTITLSDGSVRSYFALPPDPHPSAREPLALNQLPLSQPGSQLISLSQASLNLGPQSHKDGGGNNNGEKYGERSGIGPSDLKRKNEDEDTHITKRERTGTKDKGREKENEKLKEKEKDKGKAPSGVDKKPFQEAFHKYSKLIDENSSLKKNYLSNGKHGPLRCLVCGSDSKDFKDVRAVMMHAYNSMKLITDHRGLHRAMCVLIGWDPDLDPKKIKSYQHDSSEANMDVIQNTNSSSKKDERVEGMGNKEIDSKLSAEQNDEHVLKNHAFGSTSSTRFPEVNTGSYKTRGARGRGRNNTWHRDDQNKKNTKEKSKNPESVNSKGSENSCFRCGMQGHWSRTCSAPKHLIELHKASLKEKVQK